MGDLHIIEKSSVGGLSWVEAVLIERKKECESALRFADELYDIRNISAKLEEINYLLGVVKQMINNISNIPSTE